MTAIPSPSRHENHAWLVIGLNMAKHRVVISGMAASLAEADKLGLERRTNPHEPYDVARSFKIDDHTGPRMRAWMKSNDIPEDEADRCIRNIGRRLMECMSHKMN